MIYLVPPAGLHNFSIQKCYCVDVLAQISDLMALPHLELDAYSGDMGIYVWALLCARLEGVRAEVARCDEGDGTYLAVSLRNLGGDARHACT